MSDYQQFIYSKRPIVKQHGFEPGISSRYSLFDWQQSVTDWAIGRGRAALFCD